MNRQVLIIVGGGPRGLGVLERLNAIYHDTDQAPALDVYLIDPAEPGQGCHPSSQADYLLTNTVAAQVTMFSDPTVQNAGPVVAGPSFQDWANQAGYRQLNGRFVKAGCEAGLIQENDYLPRSLLGEYLTAVFDQVVAELHPAITLHQYRCEATHITTRADGRVVVQLEGGFTILGDFVVLTTGHSQNRPTAEDTAFDEAVLHGISRNPRLKYFAKPYPLKCLQTIAADAVVGIQGIGLTTYDIIAVLTEGRGGRFEAVSEQQLRYVPSGREPRILIYSRQGLPFCARASNEKGVSGQVQAKFFTRAWIDQVRQAKKLKGGNGQLDFEQDLWPTLQKEMCFAYRSVLSGTPIHYAAYEPGAEDLAAIDHLLHPVARGGFAEYGSYVSAVRNYLDQDLADACGGNVSNPVKAATDILRDVRDNLRYAVDFGGLTPESHARFLRDFIPIMNRIAVGPPKERNMQLRALLDAGVVSMGPGPAPEVSFDQSEARFSMASTQLHAQARVDFDVFIKARIDAFLPEQDASAFFTNALANGSLRPYRNGGFHPGGIDVDRNQNIIDGQGRVHRNVWALGTLAEGANFYTFVLPRPCVNSRFIQDAGKCVKSILSAIEAKTTQPLPSQHRA